MNFNKTEDTASGGGIIQDFTKGSISRQLLSFSFPLFLANLLQIIYNTADMVIVGRFVGKEGLSGVTVGGDVTNFFTFIVMGFSGASQMIISQMIGAGKKDSLGRFIGTMTTALMTVGALAMVLGLVFMDQLLAVMNTPAESWQYTKDYATVCVCGLLFIYGYNVISAVFRGMGDSRHPFVFILVASVLNIVLDLVFTAGLGMGTFGAALATVIGQAVSVIYSIWYFLRHREKFDFEFSRRDFRIDREQLRRLCGLGVPMAITSASVQFSKLFINSYLNSYGVAVSALTGVGTKLSLFINLINNATSTAGGSMVGQNIGAKNYGRVPSIMRWVFALNGVIAAAMITFVFIRPQAPFRMFTSDEEVILLSAAYLPVLITNCVSGILRSAMNTLIQGSANYRISYLVAIFDGIVNRIGFGLLLGVYLDLAYVGFWFGDAIANFTPVLIGSIFYLSGKWKTDRYVK